MSPGQRTGPAKGSWSGWERGLGRAEGPGDRRPLFRLGLFAVWSKGRDWLGAWLDEVTSEGGFVFRIIGKGKKL